MKAARRAASSSEKHGTPLSAASALRVTCEDCGHSTIIRDERLRRLEEKGCKTVDDLGKRLYCSFCFRAGGLGRSISLTRLPG